MKVTRKIVLMSTIFTFTAFIAKSQSVAMTNNIDCDVDVGYEVRDTNGGGCNVCDSGSHNIPAQSNNVFNVGGTCTPTSGDACMWVDLIGGNTVTYTHCSNNLCCMIACQGSGTAPTGCSSTGNFNVIYGFPIS
jgi:hypothetical protein